MANTPKLNQDSRDFLRNQYYYSQLLKDPKKVVDLFDTYNQFWRKVSGGDIEKYAQPIFSKMLKEYGIELNVIGIGVAPFSKRLPYLLALKPTIDILNIYNQKLINDRNEFGRELIKADTSGEIYKMLERMSQLPEIFGRAVAEGQIKNPDIAAAAVDNIAILAEFKNELDIPTSDQELLLKAPENAIQILLSEAFQKAEERAEIEGKSNYEDILNEELEKLGNDHEILNEKLESLLDEVFKKDINQETENEIINRMNSARGWGDIVGILTGIGNPKLGSAISNGTRSIIDAYQSFTLISNFGFNAATFATGLGGVVTVVSIINSYNENDQQNQLASLFAGLNNINENINKLRQEIIGLNENVLQILNQVNYLIEYCSGQFNTIENKLREILQIVEEYNNLQLEASFQEMELDLLKIQNNATFNVSSFDSFNKYLNVLYEKGIIDASNVKFTRIKDGLSILYNYLTLDNKIKYDDFKWSPIERRPILLEMLRSDFLGSLLEEDIDVWEKELPSFPQGVELNALLKGNLEMISPVIASQASIKYINFISAYFIFYYKEKFKNQNENILLRIGEFQQVFKWYSKTAFILANEKVVESMLDNYFQNALNLMLQINKERKKNLSVFFAGNDPSFKDIQLDTFLLDAVHSKLNLDYTELQTGISNSYLKDFFSFGAQLDIPFDIIQNETLHLPFMSGQKFINNGKIARLELHHIEFLKKCPENIDTFLCLLSYFKDLGILKIEKKYFIGNNPIDPNENYMRPKIYGELTVIYTITIDPLKSTLNLINDEKFKVSFTIADTRLGLTGLFNYNGQGFIGSTYRYSNLAGTGSITLWHEKQPIIISYPVDILSDAFFNLIESAIFPAAINSFKYKVTQLKGMGIYIGLSVTTKFSDLLNFDSAPLNNLFENTRQAWINLTTAVLCYSEVNLDSSLYLEMLSRKPRILETNFSLSEPGAMDALIEENLSDLLLLWINEEKDIDDERVGFAGIQVRGGYGIVPEVIEAINLPVIWISFDEKDDENPIKYSLIKSEYKKIYDNIIHPKKPVYYRPILPATNEALKKLVEPYLYFMIA